MKVIPKDAIAAEIERRIKSLNKDRDFNYLQIKELEALLSFSDSLEEEPVSEELSDAANDYVVNIRKGYPRVMDETDKYIYNAFKAGAQWQKEQMIDKACSFLHHYKEYPNHDIATDKLVEAFKMYIEL